MKSRERRLPRVLTCLLAGLLCLTFWPMPSSAIDKLSAPDGKVLIEQTDYTLTKGVTESDIFFNSEEGNSQAAAFMLTVDRNSKASFKASYKGYYSKDSTADSRRNKAADLSYGLETTTDQARAYEEATGGRVLAATNADYFNMQTGQSLGCLVMEGNIIQKNGTFNEPYFAVLKNGGYAIRDAGTDCSDVQEAASGHIWLVRDGQIVNGLDRDQLYSRNSIGLKEDGSAVIFTVDGAQRPYSVGMTQYDVANYLKKQGVRNAITLDEGGSATIATRREGGSQLEVRNRPSDGVERPVASTLMLTSTDAGDGVFDHATVTPNNKLYTPGTDVQFKASGVDRTGGQAEIPEGVSWSLADPACGSIDSKGLFTPKAGYTGDVTAQLNYNGKVVGSTTVSMADVTDISFTSDSVSLDFGEQSDLGLKVKSSGRSISYKDGDLNWNIDPKTLGSVSDNKFTAADGSATMTGRVTVTYARNPALSASVNVEIGKMPEVLMDFEPKDGVPLKSAHYHWGKNTFVDQGKTKGYEGSISPIDVVTSGSFTGHETHATLNAPYAFNGNYDESVPAGDIFRKNGYSFYLWPNNSITTYNAGAVKATKESEGGHVRFGDYSLELNYDYSSYDGSQNSNFYIRYCGDPVPITGSPTELGVWVYVPEGSWTYSLYADIACWDSSANKYVNKNLKLVHAKDGDSSNRNADNLTNATDWSGWKYCFADTSSLLQYQNEEHPLSILPGRGLFWLSYQPKGDAQQKGRKNGSIYFDNYRAVYGTSLDDLDNPRIDNIKINGKTAEENGSTVADSNAIEISTEYSDVNGRNMSGIDAQKTEILVDNKLMNADKTTGSAISRLELKNGHHVVKVRVYDKYGNAAEMNRGFIVYNGDSDSTATVSIKGNDFVPLGSDYTLKVVSAGDIRRASVSLTNLNSDIGEPDVKAVSGWKVENREYKETGYKKAALRFDLVKANTPLLMMRMPARLDDLLTNELADITFHIDKNLDTTVNSLTYTPENITFVNGSGAEETAALPAIRLPLSSYYRLDPGIQVEGMGSTVTVYKKDGSPADNVKVSLNGSEIGTTAVDGTLNTDSMKSMKAGTEYSLSAEGPDGVAETVSATVLRNSFAGGKAYRGISVNATKDNTTSQNISYLSDPVSTAGIAKVRYKASGSDDKWQEATGESRLYAFNTSRDAALINTVNISGLKAGSSYEFQVGDGSSWSDTESFKTEKADGSGSESFFVMGDTQMSGDPDSAADKEALGTMKKLAAIIKDKNPDFGLQTGDYVDNGSNLAMWEEMQEAFGDCFKSTDIIHTLGNHEYYGDQTGNIAGRLLQTPGKDYYSVEYGDVYAAVINNSADLKEACDWLVKDAAKSDCQWKILSIHQPPYYTNVNGGSEKFNELIPPAAEKAGIDAVFSGHDHSYARTHALKNGSKVEKNGVVYFICGDLGEKSRNANYRIGSDFNYEFSTQDYEGVMLYATVKNDNMVVNAYNSADGNILDTVTLKKSHNYTVYDDGYAVCSGCGHRDKIENLKYTGWLTVRDTSKRMYFVNGKYVKGWYTVGSKTYHFSDSGIMHKTTDRDTRTCTDYGRIITTCSVDGETTMSESLWPLGHDWDENHVCKRCDKVGRDIADANIEVDDATMDKPVAEVSATYNGDYLRIGSSRLECDAFLFCSDNDRVGTGTATITGEGDYYGEVTRQYKILPASVKSGSVKRESDTSQKLTWKAAKGAAGYHVEKSSDGGSQWTAVADTDKTEMTITGLEAGMTYVYRVRGYAMADGVTYESPDYSPVISLYSYHGGGGSTIGGGGSGQHKADSVAAKIGDKEYKDLQEAFNDGIKQDKPVVLEKKPESQEILITEKGTLKVMGADPSGIKLRPADGLAVSDWSESENGTYTAEITKAKEDHSKTCPSRKFSDVDTNLWYHKAVDYVLTRNFFAGEGDGVFNPDGSMTRAMFVKVLANMEGIDQGKYTGSDFSDVKAGEWYSPAVKWASENDIVAGVGNDRFDPDGSVTREQMAAIMYRYANYKKADTRAGRTRFDKFADKAGVDSWAEDAMIWATDRGIINGMTEMTLEPLTNSTRAQVAQIVMAFSEKVEL